MVVVSEEMETYFKQLDQKIDEMYIIAREARKKGGIDPVPDVETNVAPDIAGRVEELVGPKGIAEFIRELSKTMDRDKVAFKVAEKIVGDYKDSDPEKAADLAIRCSLAIKTEGVVSAPLEGVREVRIKQDKTGQYLSLYFAGPIRAAGGTTQAYVVLIADYIRRLLNLDTWKPIDNELPRYLEEIKLYDKVVNLQYTSNNSELEWVVSHLPVEVTGDQTNPEEVSAYRNQPRIETNAIRGGACLVINDGVLAKAAKLNKIIDSLGIPDLANDWDWLKHVPKEEKENIPPEPAVDKKFGDELFQGKKEEGIKEEKKKPKILPKDKFISEVIAGRPIIAHPSAHGGFRIRYGHSRDMGVAAYGFHPATMYVTDSFMAIGTQMRVERPGKSTASMPVDSIEGPVVRLRNGDVIRIEKSKGIEKILPSIEKVLFLGDVLIGFGEFAENNHKIMPSPWVEEWWLLEVKKAMADAGMDVQALALAIDADASIVKAWLDDIFYKKPDPEHAVRISKVLDVPLHPRYVYFWNALKVTDIEALRDWFLTSMTETQDTEGKTILASTEDPEMKKLLERACIPHVVDGETYCFLDESLPLIETLALHDVQAVVDPASPSVLEALAPISGVKLRDKAPYFMGLRMGRPEKAKERKMNPPVHVLFPIGHECSSQRVFQDAMKKRAVKIDVANRACPECNAILFTPTCPKCKVETIAFKTCPKCKKTFENTVETCPDCGMTLQAYSTREVNLVPIYTAAMKKINMNLPNIKAIKGMSSKVKMPEPLEKGMLRAKHEVFVYKDGTCRFDASDCPLTHFIPREIFVTVEDLKNLGYTHDIHGKPLEKPNQVLELKVQDILLPKASLKYLFKVASFIDDLLERVYGLPRYYNIKKEKDFLGHLIIGLAPHTSAGIVGRVIGFTQANVGYAHPIYHAAKRRNCFPADSTIIAEIDGIINRIPIKELFDNYFDNEMSDNGIVTKSVSRGSVNVLSFDMASNTIKMTPVIDVIKLPATDHLISIDLKLGRSFTTTYDHPVLIVENEQLKEIRAFEVKKHDRMLIPFIDILEEDVEILDLVKEFTQPRFAFLQDDLAIRGIKEFVKDLIYRKGLKETANCLGINKKTLNNYYSDRDSIPLSILLRLLDMHSLSINDIPECKLGFKRDDTLVNRYMPINDSFMRLSGYFLSEGFLREEKDTYQVDLAVSKADLRDDIMACIREVFGYGFNPYINENRITIANRVILHVFRDIIGFKATARTKRVPSFMFKLPLGKISNLIKAYFSGDGGVDPVHKTVDCTSVHRDLLVDVDFLLLRFGIFSAIDKSFHGDYAEYKIRIRGENVPIYHEKIGFTSLRKAEALKECVRGLASIMKKQEMIGKNRLVPVKDVKILDNKEISYVYSLNARDYHTVLINDHVVTHQCDGDEDGILLFMDVILNFSRAYLPSSTGAKMDTPLVISSRVVPEEVDAEAHNVDTSFGYPLEFYERSQEYPDPKDFSKIIETVKSRLGTPGQYEGMGFTHPCSSINEGPKTTYYKQLGSMSEKITAQFNLAKKIVAVDAADEAKRVISAHFTPDIAGNLRAFSTQQFRCTKCNAKYRRPPLQGKCTKCGNQNLTLTVSPSSIKKYLDIALKMVKEYNLSEYTRQRMDILAERVESTVFNGTKKQKSLSEFF
ncbi:MAG TPA: DNA-directed DNA polymerase II large subunit [Candidatus Lokiarchaeia archaeon]|nr:DNA-directed DNA polymerase II large subunit [Candidatus Lokiarchaeia archaeon]